MKNLPKTKMFSIARKTAIKDLSACEKLFPTSDILYQYKNNNLTIKEYQERYNSEVLALLDAKKIHKEFDKSILLCYEKPNEFCHRKLIRKWLADNGFLSLEYKKHYSVAVVGSRDYNNQQEFNSIMKKFVGSFLPAQTISFVSGGAKGADSFISDFSMKNKYEIKEFLPEWNKYGKKAGYVRNETIWNNADFGIAFWDGKSKGTLHSLKIAEKQHKILIIYNFTEKKFTIINNELLQEKTLFL